MFETVGIFALRLCGGLLALIVIIFLGFSLYALIRAIVETAIENRDKKRGKSK